MPSSDYRFTTRYPRVEDFDPEGDSTYIYGYSPEDRSHLIDPLLAKSKPNIRFVEIAANGADELCDVASKSNYLLRSERSIETFLLKYQSRLLYLDVSGLENRISAPLLKAAIAAYRNGTFSEIRVIYAEPRTYKVQQFKTEGYFNDLSEKIDGISPLPGFASIIPSTVEDSLFIPLLGFEGGRFTHLVESFQPPYDNIYPVIGVPGFRFEYPFVAYWGNRQPLQITEAWRQIKYAAANSSVEIFDLLSRIHKRSPKSTLKIAPIGTKPHAIGAMLYVIENPMTAELIYDNPKRKKQRTDGVGRILECSVSSLLDDRSA